MKHAYTLTEHAKMRMHQRRISPWHVLNALTRREHVQSPDVARCYDPATGVCVVVNPTRRTVVTMFRDERGK